jgi:hypothetical protein
MPDYDPDPSEVPEWETPDPADPSFQVMRDTPLQSAIDATRAVARDIRPLTEHPDFANSATLQRLEQTGSGIRITHSRFARAIVSAYEAQTRAQQEQAAPYRMPAEAESGDAPEWSWVDRHTWTTMQAERQETSGAGYAMDYLGSPFVPGQTVVESETDRGNFGVVSKSEDPRVWVRWHDDLAHEYQYTAGELRQV